MFWTKFDLCILLLWVPVPIVTSLRPATRFRVHFQLFDGWIRTWNLVTCTLFLYWTLLMVSGRCFTVCWYLFTTNTFILMFGLNFRLPTPCDGFRHSTASLLFSLYQLLNSSTFVSYHNVRWACSNTILYLEAGFKQNSHQLLSIQTLSPYTGGSTAMKWLLSSC